MATKTTRSFTLGTDGKGSVVLTAGQNYACKLTRASLPADVSTITAPAAQSVSYANQTLTLTPSDVAYSAYTSTATTNVYVTAATTVTINLSATTSTDYTVSSDSSWCTVGTDKTKITLAKNTGASRSATLTYKNAGGTTATCKITQGAGNSNSITFTATYAGTLYFNGATTGTSLAAGGTTTISNLIAAQTYTYTFTPTNTDWYSISGNPTTLSLGSGATSNDVTLKYTAYHYTDSTSSGSVTTSSSAGGSVSHTIASNYKATSVTAATYTTSGSSVISATPTNTSSVSVSAPKNLTTSSRTKTITVYADAAKTKGVTYTITQAAGAQVTFTFTSSKACTVACNSQSKSCDSTGGTMSFTGFAGESYSYTVTTSSTNTVYSTSITGLTNGGTTTYPVSGSGTVSLSVASSVTAWTLSNTAGTASNVTNSTNVTVATWSSGVTHPNVTFSYVSGDTTTAPAWFNPSLASGSQTISINSSTGLGSMVVTVPNLTDTKAATSITIGLNNGGDTWKYTFGQDAGYKITFTTNAPSGNMACS